MSALWGLFPRVSLYLCCHNCYAPQERSLGIPKRDCLKGNQTFTSSSCWWDPTGTLLNTLGRLQTPFQSLLASHERVLLKQRIVVVKLVDLHGRLVLKECSHRESGSWAKTKMSERKNRRRLRGMTERWERWIVVVVVVVVFWCARAPSYFKSLSLSPLFMIILFALSRCVYVCMWVCATLC